MVVDAIFKIVLMKFAFCMVRLMLLVTTVARMVRIVLTANVVIVVDMVMRAHDTVRDDGAGIIVADGACG